MTTKRKNIGRYVPGSPQNITFRCLKKDRDRSLGSPLPANAPSALALRSKRASAVSRHPVPTVLSPYALYRVVVEHDTAGPSGGGGNACPAFSPVIHYESGATSPPIQAPAP